MSRWQAPLSRVSSDSSVSYRRRPANFVPSPPPPPGVDARREFMTFRRETKNYVISLRYRWRFQYKYYTFSFFFSISLWENFATCLLNTHQYIPADEVYKFSFFSFERKEEGEFMIWLGRIEKEARNERIRTAPFNRKIRFARNLRQRSYSYPSFHIKAFSCKLRHGIWTLGLNIRGALRRSGAPRRISNTYTSIDFSRVA